ncbi:tyrosine-type recombinase/integrase [Rhodocyclaceae bacterium SMB388]
MSKLTATQLKALGASDHGKKLRDEGGLFGTVRSGAKGTSVYFDWRYRRDGKVKQIAVGAWPKMSLVQIRAERDRLKVEADTGTDPAEGRKVERLRAKADQAEAVEAQRSRLAEIEAQSARMTVRALFERWERVELSRRKDKGAEVHRMFEKDVMPKWGEVAAEDITRPMVAALLDGVAERGARIVARNLLGDIRQMFGFAIKRGFVENDPTSHLKRDDFGRKVERDRVLSESEVRQLWDKVPDADLWDSSASAIWIMLSTCCRVGEIASARIEHLDLDAGAWRIPSENSKNARAHTVYLSDFAQQHFAELKARAERLGSDWLCPSKHKDDSHVCPKSLAKQIGDRQRPGLEPMKGRTPLTESLVLSGGKWTPHDLRRTGATLMGTLGVRPDVIEKCLNHVEQNRLVRIYQRQELKDEQREAWRLLGERLDLLTREDAENVVTLRGAA